MGMRRIILLLASVALAMLLSSGASLVKLGNVASAAPSGKSEKIVFGSYRSGSSDIYIMNPDGSELKRLTSTAQPEGGPTISPDGTKIAFERSVESSNAEIYVMNSDGSDQTRLTFSPGHDQSASFSPDGRKIVFHSHRDRESHIYIMNSDGSDQTRLTTEGAGGAEPELSPDGSKIVFYAQRFNSKDDGRPHIYIMNSDGSNQIKLTNGPGYAESGPTFSPDGTKIAFEANQDEAGIGQHAQIYTMNSDGTQPTRLTSNVANDVDPSYSPDGSRIAFMSDRDGDEEIYAMNSDGRQQTNLTNTMAVDHSPDWGQVAELGPASKTDCKDGGWRDFGFRNQGQCIKAVNHATPADTTAPEITVTGPEGTVSEDQVTFTLSTNEPVTWKCTYTLTRPGESTPVLYGIDPCATGTQSFFTEHDGTWVFTFEATDAAGNTATVTKTLIRDRTDPT
jgi:dipeptidyl aminopeptidase/acylaminoacyl peptidase